LIFFFLPLYRNGCQNQNKTQPAIFLSQFFALCCTFSLLVATVDLRAPAAIVPLEQFAVQLVLILRVGSALPCDLLASLQVVVAVLQHTRYIWM
jgi:hypothetical protein